MSIKSITTTELNEALQSAGSISLFDVRKKPAFESYPDTLPDATWQAFDQVESWATALSDEVKNNPVVVYCVHGHEISQNAAQALSDLGFDAKYLGGGWVAWNDAGLKMDASSS